jgi:hypothetical protein
MKKTIRILTALATVLMIMACLTSCDSYGFLSSLGLPARLQAASLDGASERYYATGGEVTSVYDVDYSGRLDGVSISYSGRVTQTTRYKDVEGDFKYHVNMINSYGVTQGRETTSKLEEMTFAYVDGYMYFSTGVNGRAAKVRDEMAVEDFAAMMQFTASSSPYMKSSRITDKVGVTENAEEGTVTAVFTGYAEGDDGELTDWLASYVGCSGMSCEITDLKITAVYSLRTRAIRSEHTYVKYTLTDGEDTSLECELEFADTYSALDESGFDMGSAEKWKETDGLDYLFYAQSSISDFTDWTEGSYEITTVVEDITAEKELISAKDSVVYSRNGYEIKLDVTSEVEEDGRTYTAVSRYRDGTLTTETTSDGGTETTETQLSQYEANAMLDTILVGTISFSLADVGSVSTSVDGDCVVLKISTAKFSAEYVIGDDMQVRSCKVSFVKRPNPMNDDLKIKTTYTLVDNFYIEE